MTKPRLDEAGVMDFFRAQGRATDPAMAGMNLSQRMAAMSRMSAMDNVARAAMSQWQQKVMDLTRANQNMPVDDTAYMDNLQDFVENSLLQKSIESLDQASRAQVNAQISSLLQSRNDPKKLASAFKNLVVATVAARQDPQKTSAASTQAPSTASPANTAKQMLPLVQKFLGSAVSGQQQAAMKTFLQGQANQKVVRSTGNPTVDAFLNALGISTR